ncbi:MAG TPA: 4Fe-4S dicluster domain-containing protein [Luteolibacter sp.]|nr:4Fe-4S dicluster domain-containing protein [Luteolibacter sp.]
MAFADAGHWLSTLAIRSGLWPQFSPSLLATLQGFTWISAACLLIVGLTLVFGRVYCAMLCPLGVLMDFSAWLARRTGKKRRLEYHRGRPRLQWLVLAVCVAGLLAGSAVPLALLEPYSVFGRITAATLRPAVGAANHQLSASGWMLPVKWSPVAPATLGVALGTLLVIGAAAVLRGRLWCNTLCPVGTVLGLLSRHAWLRLQIADAACISCSRCEQVCPAQCIDFKNHRIDHSRCVMCLDCVSSCKRSGIHFQKAPRKPHPATQAEAPHARHHAMPAIDRRGFLTGMAALPAAALVDRSQRSTDEQHQQPPPVLPPGARSLKHFQSRCTACHLCVTHCPEQVLRPSITAHGLAGFLQPWQDFSVSFCSYNCSNCSQVCPTGAIEPVTVEQRRTIRTGSARFIQDLCVVQTKGTSCGACNEHCPTQAVHMVPWKNGLTIPEINAELCIGCGGCEFICPVRPAKAIVVDGLARHERAKAVDRGIRNSVRKIEEEFPF